MAETNWENWYSANSNSDSGADKLREPLPDWMSWIDNPLFQDSSSLTPAPPAAGRWSLSEEPEPQNTSPIEQQPPQTLVPDVENLSMPAEPKAAPPLDSLQETRPLPTIKPKPETPPPSAVTPEAPSTPDNDAETLQTFVVSSILPLTHRPRKNMKPSAPKELPNDTPQQSDNGVLQEEESPAFYEDESQEQMADTGAPQEEESPAFHEDEPQEQIFDDGAPQQKESLAFYGDEPQEQLPDDNIDPSAVIVDEEPVEQLESEEPYDLSSDEMSQESVEPIEDDVAPIEEPLEQSAEEAEMLSDAQPEEDTAVEPDNTVAFPLQTAQQEETDSSQSPPAKQDKKQKTGFLQKMQSFLGQRSQAGQSQTSASGQREREPVQPRPVNPDRPRSAKPRNDRSRAAEPARRESTRSLEPVRNDRLDMRERKEIERLHSKEREKKERAREQERMNRKRREEVRRLEMERIQTADPRDPNFRRTLSEQDIFGGAEAEYMYAFSSQRYQQDTQGRNMERSRTGSQPERRSNYSAARSRDGRTSSASPRSLDTPSTGQQTRRTEQTQSNRSAAHNRRRKGPNYRLILCVIMLAAVVLDFIFLGMFLFQRNKATELNGQIETLKNDKETLTTQVGTLQQENITLEANMMSALPEPTTARTDNLPDLIPQLTDGIYLIRVSEGYQYLKVPNGYLTDKINTFGNAPGYAATNADPPTCSYYVLYADKVVGLAEGDTGFVSTDRTATGNGSSLPSGFYAFVASFFNH